MSGDFYVYLHRKKTTGEVFYVGKGTNNRSRVRNNKSKFWNSIVEKHGYVIEIVESGLQEWYAFELEYNLIAYYGRRDLGRGPLVNLTDGGEGASGSIVSEERKLQVSRRMKGDNHPNASKTVYEFINIETGKEFSGTPLEFSSKFNFQIFPLLCGKCNSLNTWTLKTKYETIPHDVLLNPQAGSRHNMFDPVVYSFTNLLTNSIVEMTRFDFSNKYKVNVNSLFNSRISYIVDHWCLTQNKQQALSASKYNYSVYIFKNKEETFKGTRYQFHQKYGIDPGKLLVKNKTAKSVHGWSLVNDLT